MRAYLTCQESLWDWTSSGRELSKRCPPREADFSIRPFITPLLVKKKANELKEYLLLLELIG